MHNSMFLDFRFSARGECVTAGTQGGYRIYQLNPLQELARREVPDGVFSGIRSVELLLGSNILGCVGGGAVPRWPDRCVVLWDDRSVSEIARLWFSTRVLAIRFLEQRLVVILNRVILVYDVKGLKQLNQFESSENPLGLCTAIEYNSCLYLSYPGLAKGEVTVQVVPILNEPRQFNEDHRLRDLLQITTHTSDSFHNAHVLLTVTFVAHSRSLVRLVSNNDASLLATASEKGTLIRIFEASTGTLFFQLRRGKNEAVIHSIAFSFDSQWLLSYSDTDTLHIFSLSHGKLMTNLSESRASTGDVIITNLSQPPLEEAPLARQYMKQEHLNRRSRFRFLVRFSEYFGSFWSFCTTKLDPTHAPYTCTFLYDNKIAAIGANGMCLLLSFNPNSYMSPIHILTSLNLSNLKATSFWIPSRSLSKPLEA